MVVKVSTQVGRWPTESDIMRDQRKYQNDYHKRERIENAIKAKGIPARIEAIVLRARNMMPPMPPISYSQMAKQGKLRGMKVG